MATRNSHRKFQKSALSSEFRDEKNIYFPVNHSTRGIFKIYIGEQDDRFEIEETLTRGRPSRVNRFLQRLLLPGPYRSRAQTFT